MDINYNTIVLLGEIKKNNLVINIISKIPLVKPILKFSFGKTININKINKFKPFRLIIKVPLDKSFSYQLSAENCDTTKTKNIKINSNGNIIIVNCDAHWQLPTNEWTKVSKEKNIKMMIHIGDQIYHDLLFERLYKKLKSISSSKFDNYKNIIKHKFYLNYFESWNNFKKNLLETVPHLMFGDDHDIVDDDTYSHLQEDIVYKFLKKCALQVFKEIQEKLQINESPHQDLYYRLENKILYIMIGRIYSIKYKPNDILTLLKYPINRMRGKFDKINILLSKPPINKTASFPASLIFNSVNDDFTSFYNYLKDLTEDGIKLNIISGDLHRFVHFNIYYNNKFITSLFIVPPITSAPPVFGSNVYINLPNGYNINKIRDKKTNGYFVYSKKNSVIKYETYWKNFIRNEIYILLVKLVNKFKNEDL
jgi:hypothetical protein